MLVLSAAATVLILAAAPGRTPWQTARSLAHDRLATLQERVSHIGGKVLDTASSLAEPAPLQETPTPTPIVLLPPLPDESLLAAKASLTSTQPSTLIVAPTTVPEAVAMAALQATNPVTPTAEATAVVAAVSTEAPTAAPTPTASPAPPTPTRAQPTPTTPPTPTPQAVAAGVGGPGELLYTVQPGDNWFTIARRFGITQEALAAYNRRTPNDVLQVNERLRIPPADATPPPPPTPTPTRPRPTATPTPTPTVPVPALPAPQGLLPRDDDGFTADSQAVLRWDPVPGMTAADYYYVYVEFLMQDGSVGFVDDETTRPWFEVPRWTYEVAATPNRIFTWTVQVRRRLPSGQVVEVSPISRKATFYWR
ncbi:MAG: LysM peptidoglycan-binding domain-containing protein [Caldilineales bacterium]|nr:LysM peptidoglycan-binding domain-containing protein [Caldilineales bacterium]MDW8317234.1 LysM domain-containing protein [Anaerolineae bacterium]